VHGIEVVTQRLDGVPHLPDDFGDVAAAREPKLVAFLRHQVQCGQGLRDEQLVGVAVGLRLAGALGHQGQVIGEFVDDEVFEGHEARIRR